MASYTVNVASEALGQPAGNLNFSIAQGLDMSKGVWQVALVQYSVFNTYYNVSAALGNSSFSFYDGATTYTATLKDGVYGAEDLIAGISLAITSLTSSTVAEDIVLAVNLPTLGFTLTLTNGCEIDFSAGATSKMYILLGFAAINYTTQDELIYAPQQANIDASTSVLSIRVPGLLKSNTLNGQPSNILYQFAPDLPAGNNLAANISYPVFQEIYAQQLTNIQIQVTDSLGRIIDFNNGAGNTTNGSTFTLLFKERT